MAEDDVAVRRPTGLISSLRGFAVMILGPIVLISAVAGGVASAVRSLLRGRRPSTSALAATAGVGAYIALARPWMRTWGATAEERARALPGDDPAVDPSGLITHAVTIDAPPEEVWPWLAQIGQDRGGFYSYEWLENLAGCEMRNADRIHPEWQRREIGEPVFLHPSLGLKVDVFEPGRAIGLAGWGSWVLEPEGPGRTRLLGRGRPIVGPGGALYYTLLVELPHFIMQRKMMLGIKERAEREAGRFG